MGPSQTTPEEGKRHPAAAFLFLVVPILAYLLLIPFPVSTAAGKTVLAILHGVLGAAFLLVALRFLPRMFLISKRTLLLGMALLALPLFFVPPLGSSDVYANAYFGSLVVRHGDNPYTVADASELDDPFLTRTGAPRPFRSPYGPLWTTVSALIVAASGGNAGVAVFLFRLVAFAALIGTVLFVHTVVGAHFPRHSWIVPLVAWNPFLLFEVVNNAHNDIVMVLFFAAALVALLQRRDVSAYSLIALGALVKFVPLLLIPFAAAMLWRDKERIARLRRTLLGVAIAALVTVVAYVPYWAGAATFWKLSLLGTGFVALPWYHPLQILAQLLGALGIHDIWGAVRMTGAAAFVVVAVVLIWRSFVAERPDAIPQHAVWAVVAVLGTLILYFQPWYLVWAIPLLPILNPKISKPLIIGLSVLGLLSYPWY